MNRFSQKRKQVNKQINDTLQPREQKEKESRRPRSQTRQVLVTPLPGRG